MQNVNQKLQWPLLSEFPHSQANPQWKHRKDLCETILFLHIQLSKQASCASVSITYSN